MKTLYGVAAALVAVSLCLPGAALAGQKNTFEVRILSSYAEGAMGSARNSRDSTQSIGCAIRGGGSSSPYTTGSCSAFDADGKVAYCSFAYSPELDKAVASISDDSFLRFGWDQQGICSWITVASNSRYEPRQR